MQANGSLGFAMENTLKIVFKAFKRAGGGGGGGLWPGEGRNMVFYCFWQKRVSATRYFLPDQKILFLSVVIGFWNLENIGNYSTRANFKRDFPKLDIFGIQKSISYSFGDKCLNLGGYVLGTKKTFDWADFRFRPQKWKYWILKIASGQKILKIGYRQTLKFNIPTSEA